MSMPPIYLTEEERKTVELDFIDSISPATIHKLLKKRSISLI